MIKVAVLGGGLSGLSLAFILKKNLKQRGIDAEIKLFEKEKTLGGTIGTKKMDGFITEKGANGFLDNKPYTVKLCEDLNIQTIKSNEKAKKRYIYSKGNLHLLPEKQFLILFRNLISPLGRLKFMAEPLIKQNIEDETVAEFVTRRLGKETLIKLIGPLVCGIYAGNPWKMSIKSAFPKVKALEENYGGLIKGMLTMKKKSGSPEGTLLSFKNGLSDLIQKLEESLGENIKRETEIKEIRKEGKDFVVSFKGGEYKSQLLFSCLPSYQLSKATKKFDKKLSYLCKKIPYAPIHVAALGYKKDEVDFPFDGFGFLYALNSIRSTIGILWDSSIFPRAPEGYALIRLFIGGAMRENVKEMTKKQVIQEALSEVERTMHIKTPPIFTDVTTCINAIPQYNMEHKEITDYIENLQNIHKGLYLGGNALKGVGINDCSRSAYELTDEALGKI